MFTFKVGDPVIFGRPGGEQTIGRVKDIGPKNLKIEQLGTRGVAKPRPVGTIWTVPPSLVQKYDGSLPAGGQLPVAPRPTLVTVGLAFRKGDPVEFTHPTKGVVAGFVKSVNAKSVTLENTDDGHPTGWRVPSDVLRRRDGAAAPVVVMPEVPAWVKVGAPVTYSGYTWQPNKGPVQGSVAGIVTSVDARKGEVEVFSGSDTRFTKRLPYGAVTITGRRDEAALLAEFAAVYSMLEPERLTADGERSRSEVARLRAELTRAYLALTMELGRKVSESEAYSTERM